MIIIIIFFFTVNVGTFTYESGPGDYEEFPYTDEPVYILGEIYSAQYGMSVTII